MSCQHENILTYRYWHDLSIAWACADCGMRFEPTSALDKSFRDGVEHEREECAKVCESGVILANYGQVAAKAIRARSNT